MNCCPDSFYAGWVESDWQGFVGGSTLMRGFEQTANCYGYTGPPFDPWPSWNNLNPSVCSTNNGTTTGEGPGLGTVQAIWTAYEFGDWESGGAGECNVRERNIIAEALCDIVDCTSVTSETSQIDGVNTDSPPLSFTQTKFRQTLSGGDFVGRRVQERPGLLPNQDVCHEHSNGQSPWDPASLSGGIWPVVLGPENRQQWAWDAVGYRRDLVDWYRNIGPMVGVEIPCTARVYQAMEIECNAALFYRYQTNNLLMSTIDYSHVTNCRHPMLGQLVCHQINQ